MLVPMGQGSLTAITVLRSLPRKFGADASGAVAIVFALSVIPMLVAAGVAIDYSRALSVKSELQKAADAGVLAARSSMGDAQSAAKLRATGVVKANENVLHNAVVAEPIVNLEDGSAKVTLRADMPTTLTKLLGINTLPIEVTAKAMAGSQALEIALVLDNTGSMRNDMDALKQAASELTQTVFAAAPTGGQLRVAVVPFVGAVNIGNGPSRTSWMDMTASARYHGALLEYSSIAYEAGCTYTSSGSGGSGPGAGTGGNDRQSSLEWLGSSFAVLIGLSPAQASGLPPGHSVSNCFLGSNIEVSHWDLFDEIPNASWKGCVEARPAPYDVDDTPPTTSNPDTLFVPYFWPDEPDVSSTAGLVFPNNYLDDNEAALPTGFNYVWTDGNAYDWGRAYSLLKYNGTNATMTTTGPLTTGPNAACPDELLPLTNSKSDVLSAIGQLSHWEGSGTVASEGVAWGWRVLSPGEPFAEGAAYGDAKKVIVLMTDGMNMVAEQASYATYSDYTAYGNVARAREDSLQTYEGFTDHLNDRLLAACENAKAAGVEIYTVTFGSIDSATEALYEQCATAPPMHHSAADANDLVVAFQKIGLSLSTLHLVE